MTSRPLAPEIVASSSFRFEKTEDLERALKRDGQGFYSRWDNPTVQQVERRVSALVGAEATLCFGSGMAAVSSALLCGLEARRRLVLQAQCYGATWELARTLLPRWGVQVDWWDLDRPDAIAGEAGVVYVETPTNPCLRVADIQAAVARARAAGAIVIVDNTFATPLNQRPLALGADVEVHSATKYLGGHHDLLAGTVSGSKAFVDRLWNYRKLLGGILDPFPAFLLHRGLETLELRVARHDETALALARWLEGRRGVRRVFHPFLESHPDHALARRQMQGGGGMLSFEVDGDYAAAVRVVDRLKVIALATSLGGTCSLASMPANTSHAGLSPAERARTGVAESLVRLSIGLEPYEALRDDLAQALSGA